MPARAFTRSLSVAIAGLAGLATLSAAPAVAADAVADFYRSHPLNLSVGSTASSGFTVYARLLSRHYPRHLPGNPTIVIENLPGASGLRHMEFLAAVAPKDGSAIGLMNPAVTIAPMLRPQTAKRSSATLAWLGSANSEVSTCLFWPHSGVTGVADLKKREYVIGSSGGTGSSYYGTRAMREILGFPWRMVSGYQGSPDVMLAGQRGEIDGTCILLTSALKSQYWDQFKKGAFKVILQMPPGNHPDLPGVANTMDIATTDEQRQVLNLIYGSWAYGRPFAAPAETPAPRLAALRQALKATLEDKAFLAEATKIGVSVDYMSPEELARRVAEIQATPEPVVAKVRALIPSAKKAKKKQ